MSAEPAVAARTAALPWHAPQWERVERTIAAGRLAHAILLRGPGGTGKTAFARRLLAAVLCTAPADTPRPCGACRSCTLNGAGNHPDRMEITPAEGKRSIGIDQVREMIDTLGLTARLGGYKVALVHPAERLTHAAANTLLKTLEEPPGDAVIVLVADRSTLLPATVRSRCQTMDFHPPDAGTALTWLEGEGVEAGVAAQALRLAGGAPLLACAIAGSGRAEMHESVARDLLGLVSRRAEPVAVAERWSAIGMTEVLAAVATLAGDLARIRVGASDAALVHADAAGTLHTIARGLDSTSVHRLLDAVVELQRAQARQLNLNAQLAFEGLASRWWQAGGRAG